MVYPWIATIRHGFQLPIIFVLAFVASARVAVAAAPYPDSPVIDNIT